MIPHFASCDHRTLRNRYPNNSMRPLRLLSLGELCAGSLAARIVTLMHAITVDMPRRTSRIERRGGRWWRAGSRRHNRNRKRMNRRRKHSRPCLPSGPSRPDPGASSRSPAGRFSPRAAPRSPPTRWPHGPDRGWASVNNLVRKAAEPRRQPRNRLTPLRAGATFGV